MALRALDRLQRAAAKVSTDMTAVGSGRWTCSVGSDYLLAIHGPEGRATANLHAEMDEGWFLHESFTPKEREAGMCRDAEELVAQQVIVLLRARGIAWPRCAAHDAPVEASEGFWICAGDPEHDLAAIGQLCDTQATVAGAQRPRESP